MPLDVNLPIILSAALIASASPGPATLALAGTSMASGRTSGLALASGISTGSLMWSIAAALGLSALMLANVWVFELIRYIGSAYLMFLAYKAARSALSSEYLATSSVTGGKRSLYAKGLALHLTNPKAILFFASLFTIGIPPGTEVQQLLIVIAAVGLQSFLVFHCYALLFSSQKITEIYLKLRRWFDAAFALGFGSASIKVLTAKVQAA